MASHVIAIDGPAASGKSSTARAVAETLGFSHLDSGALYRGVTLVGLREIARRGLAVGNPVEVLGPEAVLRAAEERGLTLQPDGAGFAIYLEGEPVDDEIRGPAVTALVSPLSATPVVREWVNSHLRKLVRAGMDVVVDGRDIGTVVFPEADLKIFLTATPEARARRRLSQRGDRVDHGELTRESRALADRDQADASRAVAPLKRAEDAVELDTTGLTFREQVERIVTIAKDRGLAAAGPG